MSVVPIQMSMIKVCLFFLFWQSKSTLNVELDEMSTGPIPVGTHEFVLEASGPNPALIPAQEVVGVTVVLITCSYREQEFVRIGEFWN